jgi:signal transduction histidine kinase
VLSVRDSGVAVAPHVLPRVFDLFVQEREVLDRSQGGLGIGLTIVRSLVERLGGSVSARSDGTNRGQRIRHSTAGKIWRLIALI